MFWDPRLFMSGTVCLLLCLTLWFLWVKQLYSIIPERLLMELVLKPRTNVPQSMSESSVLARGRSEETDLVDRMEQMEDFLLFLLLFVFFTLMSGGLSGNTVVIGFYREGAVESAAFRLDVKAAAERVLKLMSI